MTPDEEDTARQIRAAEARWRAQRDLDQANLLHTAFLLVWAVAIVLAAVIHG